MGSPNVEKLERLQSSKHTQLLDVVDKLREKNLSSLLPLPPLIVCGDQSSGKSSVLEAISGVPFPKKDNLCTRFATEVRLRKTKESEKTTANVSIQPGQGRSEIDKANLENFARSLTDIGELPDAIQEAKEAMGLGSQGGNAFSTDVLRVKVRGTCMPQLTIVDLPGLIHSENKMQTAQDVDLVSKLVKSYMVQPRSIILAVISAKNDYANQIVLKRAREEDRSGKRTLGIITKPDTLHHGSDSEAAFLNLANNLDVSFALGWHVVRNLDSNGSSTHEDRDQMEDSFFKSSSWRSLDSSNLGAASLRKKLSDILFKQISRELPKLMQEIERNKQGCQEELSRLGRSRRTEEEQRLFLMELSQKTDIVCRAGCDGSYDHSFFDDIDTKTQGAEVRRFRSAIQNQGRELARALDKRGAQWVIDEKTEPGSNKITRADAIDTVVALIQKSRGRELPGTYDPMLISKLFQEYSKPWESIAQDYVNAIWQQAKLFLESVMRDHADEAVCEAYQRLVLDLELDVMLHEAEKALQFLLGERGRPAATLNHYFIDNVAKLRMARLKPALIKHLQAHTVSDYHVTDSFIRESQLEQVLAGFNLQAETDMDRYAAGEIFDKMQAYYKVAMKRFLDNVPSLVVESYIVKHLLNIFEPLRIFKMKSSLVQQIAGESPEKEAYRQSLDQEMSILNSAEAICKRYAAQADVFEVTLSDTGVLTPQDD